MPECIVLARFRSLSQVNQQVRKFLTQHFPENRIVEIDVWELMKRSKWVQFQMLLHGLWHNGLHIITRRRGLRDSLLYTPFAFNKIRQLIRAALHRERVRFTFQTQSFFDASLPTKPHFVYTDHTHLANLRNPTFQRRQLWGDSWIAKEREIYLAATMVFVWSNNIKQSLIEDYGVPAHKIERVLVGCNAEANAKDVSFELTRYKKGAILFVGVAWERKGGPELLKAFCKVRTHFPDATLRIAGCSPRIELPGVEVIGRIPVERMEPIFQDASVFCMPSRAEPFGIAVVEAMSFGLPVVTTNIEALPEIVEDGQSGFLVNPLDPESIATALMKLLGSSELCARMGERGRQIATDLYSWSKTGSRISATIAHVLNCHPGGL